MISKYNCETYLQFSWTQQVLWILCLNKFCSLHRLIRYWQITFGEDVYVRHSMHSTVSADCLLYVHCMTAFICCDSLNSRHNKWHEKRGSQWVDCRRDGKVIWWDQHKTQGLLFTIHHCAYQNLCAPTIIRPIWKRLDNIRRNIADCKDLLMKWVLIKSYADSLNFNSMINNYWVSSCLLLIYTHIPKGYWLSIAHIKWKPSCNYLVRIRRCEASYFYFLQLKKLLCQCMFECISLMLQVKCERPMKLI